MSFFLMACLIEIDSPPPSTCPTSCCPFAAPSAFPSAVPCEGEGACRVRTVTSHVRWRPRLRGCAIERWDGGGLGGDGDASETVTACV